MNLEQYTTHINIQGDCGSVQYHNLTSQYLRHFSTLLGRVGSNKSARVDYIIGAISMLSQKLSRIELKEEDFDEYWRKVKTPENKDLEAPKKQKHTPADLHRTRHNVPPNSNN